MERPLLIDAGAAGDVWRIRLQGDIDRDNVEQLRAALERSEGHAQGSVELDLSGAQYLDSAALHVLSRLARRAQARPHVRIVAPTGSRAARILELSGLDQVLDVVGDVGT
jgi:anti-anti-sigma factor